MPYQYICYIIFKPFCKTTSVIHEIKTVMHTHRVTLSSNHRATGKCDKVIGTLPFGVVLAMLRTSPSRSSWKVTLVSVFINFFKDQRSEVRDQNIDKELDKISYLVNNMQTSVRTNIYFGLNRISNIIRLSQIVRIE